MNEKVFMKGYKGFNKGLICKDKQYAENTVFEENKAEICKRGMHFCENPLDVLDFYPLIDNNGDMNEFATVEALDEVQSNDDKKFCTKKLKIGAKLKFADFVKASIKFVIEKCNRETEKSSGDFAQMASSGYSAKMASSGDSAKMASSGDDGVVMCAGRNGMAKAKKGSWITLAEWVYDENKDRYIPKSVVTKQVDGEVIKEDVFYKLVDGEFTEV